MQVINECPDGDSSVPPLFRCSRLYPEEEYKGRSDAYIDFLINEMLPMIHQETIGRKLRYFL